MIYVLLAAILIFSLLNLMFQVLAAKVIVDMVLDFQNTLETKSNVSKKIDPGLIDIEPYANYHNVLPPY